MREVWRLIPGYNSYSASNLGRIKRRLPANSYGNCGTYVGKILKTSPARAGYRKITIRNEKHEIKTVLVHRLIALAFKGLPPTPEHEVAHWDNNKTNNRTKNLRWATGEENAYDRFRHGTRFTGLKGSKNCLAKISERDVLSIRKRRAQGARVMDLAEEYEMHYVNISRICNRHTWSHI